MNHKWGIDLGGTKIEGVILEEGPGLSILERKRLPTEGHLGYEHILGNIKRLIDQMADVMGTFPKSLGIGTPGTLDPDTQTMKNSNSTSLNGRPLKSDLENLLGIPVKMSNDANCFAVAEATMGIVPDVVPNATVVFGIIMGTGVGGGVVVNGKVIGGRHGIGGEWGHNFMDESGGPCYCGLSGCVEKVIAGPSLERFYLEHSGIHKNLKDIVAAYRTGEDQVATSTMHRLFHFFGKGVASVINILDPDAIVIGGGVGNIDELYTHGKKEIEKYVFNHTLKTPILRPKLGDSAGVFGAALL